MANTASILWPSAQPAPDQEAWGGPEWTFYTQVSVSGPSVCTTVHRGESHAGHEQRRSGTIFGSWTTTCVDRSVCPAA